MQNSKLFRFAMLALVLALAGSMASCAGATSSTDEALSNPGDGYLGSYRFDVDPQAEFVEVTPVVNPFSNTKIGDDPEISITTLPPGCRLMNSQNRTSFAQIIHVNDNCTLTGTNGTLSMAVGGDTTWMAPGDSSAGPPVNISAGGIFTLSSGTAPNSITISVATPVPTAAKTDSNLNIHKVRAWNPGTGAIDFFVNMAYSNPIHEIYNVRITPAGSTRMGVATANSTKCSDPWSACKAAGNDGAIVYVADSSSDGPLTVRRCYTSFSMCSTNYLSAFHSGCSSLAAHWTLQEAAAQPYSFWADVYGDIHLTTPLTSDSFYDENTASIYLRPKKMAGTASANPPEGADSNSMVPGEWFYVHYYVDNSGNNRQLPFDPTPGIGDRRIEDTGNINAWSGGTNSTANYWAINQITWSIRFDPAIIELNASDTNDGPANGSVKFSTTNGTVLAQVYDPNGSADGWNMTSSDAAAGFNKMGIYYNISTSFLASMTLYPNPCGTMPGNNCNAADGFANIDIDVAYIPLRVRTTAAPGQGSRISISYDSFTVIRAGRTNGQPYNRTAWWNDVYGVRSANWPTWCSNTPGASCNYLTGPGQFNNERTYICVQ